MSRNRMSGFTLIELMVVIVIIGVLASLAIPRFTEASGKAKVAEAPRVIASYESGYLAAVAENGDRSEIKKEDLVFEIPEDSRWWEYEMTDDGDAITSTAKSAMAKFAAGGTLVSTYEEATVGTGDCFRHTSTSDVAEKMVPNFIKGGCQ